MQHAWEMRNVHTVLIGKVSSEKTACEIHVLMGNKCIICSLFNDDFLVIQDLEHGMKG
jgi:hypothetical protein